MKFKYLDKVKVISGFYEGCEGTVTDISKFDSYYEVEIEKVGPKNKLRTKVTHIFENNLKKID